MHGILPLNKPKGKTSFYLVHVLRRIFQEKTIGHAGTLDPFATGVMILLIGRPFTKLSDTFLANDKEYTATLLLGSSTDTYDCDGLVNQTSTKIPTLDEVKEALNYFQGTISQIPPMFSAKKVGGKKLYDLARKGIEIERKPCLVTVKTELVSYLYPYLTLNVQCSKGTYIRSIADDLGKMLGTFAHLTDLKRTRSGSFSLSDCLDLEVFQNIQSVSDNFTVDETGIIRCKSLESLEKRL